MLNFWGWGEDPHEDLRIVGCASLLKLDSTNSETEQCARHMNLGFTLEAPNCIKPFQQLHPTIRGVTCSGGSQNEPYDPGRMWSLIILPLGSCYARGSACGCGTSRPGHQ